MGSDFRVRSSIFEKVLSLLENIKSTDAGSVIYEHVADMLEEIDTRDRTVGLVYAEILDSLLGAISSHCDDSSVLRLQIKMVRLRLAPPLSDFEIITLKKHIKLIATGVTDGKIDVEKMQQGLTNIPGLEFTSEDYIGCSDVSVNQDKQYLAMRSGSRKEHVEVNPEGVSTLKNQDLDEIRKNLARHVKEAIVQNEQFGILLSVELEALRLTETIQNVNERRSALMEEIESLIHKHVVLSEKFSNASKYLTMIEADNQQLTDELDRVRLLSLTDELTTLSNRRAFTRRLEEEVGRVKRYDCPISLTLIDLDHFKKVNDQYGHAGGDAVLRTYAEEVLSIFRHHDMVARYGGEEFAVILPNTKMEGALSALRKMQEGVSKMLCILNDKTINMPTFSAGLAEYIDGETPSQFIKRADDALYKAKHCGRNRIEMAGKEKIKRGELGNDVSAHIN